MEEAATAPANPVGDVLDTLVEIDRSIAALAALRLQFIQQARLLADAEGSSELERRAFRAELASALLVPEPTADRLMSEASTLVSHLPATLAALVAGRLSARHARVLVDETVGLDPDARADVESAALRFAGTLTAAQFARRVRMLRERRAPENLPERAALARDARDVTVDLDHDGMAWLTAHLPVPEAVAIHSRLTEAARAAHRDGDARTLPQLRADLLCAAMLGHGSSGGFGGGVGDGSGPAEGRLGIADRRRFAGIRPTVLVTVPVLSLLGRSHEPATLEGEIPIDVETARELAGEATGFIRVLTHPETGITLSMGRERYRISEELRRWLQLRDGGCRFAGCGRAARFADIDHTADWQYAGASDHDNLAHLCRGHHVLKHQTAWSVESARDGALTWTSPHGRRVTTEPARRAEPPP